MKPSEKKGTSVHQNKNEAFLETRSIDVSSQRLCTKGRLKYYAEGAVGQHYGSVLRLSQTKA